MDSFAPIGVFDSGIGGLTVLNHCVRLLPHENFCYFGDNLRAPYGNRSREELFARLFAAANLFADCGVKAIVVACNTLSTNCLDSFRCQSSVPVVGTFPALQKGRSCRRLLVLATRATLSSFRYRSDKHRRQGETIDFAPEKLVAAIEENAPDWEKIGIANHLPPLACDGVVLGCTHFVFLREQIARYYHAPCFENGERTAKTLQKCLKNNINPQKLNGKVTFLGECGERNRSIFVGEFFSPGKK